MMEEPILITWLNDFVFCPRSIYFHNLYGEKESLSFQEVRQINGTKAHETVDRGTYSTRKDVLTGITVFSEEYGLIGKIDLYDAQKGVLTERKKRITTVYDGYVFQLYGQYFAMKEAGYPVSALVLRSMDDNRRYLVPLPEEDPDMLRKFRDTVAMMHRMDMRQFVQPNPEKCANCIYEPLCDSSRKEERL